MSVVEGGPNTAGLIARVQNILLKPKEEWAVIDGEAATIPGLFTGYAVILAALPAIATFLGGFLFKHNLVFGLIGGIAGYVLGLVGVFILGFIIDALAPSFDGQKNPVQGMKVAVYANTAGWVAGIAGIIPVAGAFIAILGGLYGLYLLYLGLPTLMKVPQEKATGYFVVTLVVAIVVNLVIGAVVGMVAAMALIGAGVGAAAGIH